MGAIKQDIIDQLDPIWVMALPSGGDDFARERIPRRSARASGAWRRPTTTPRICNISHGECAVPTESHLALNGIILPRTDAFWDDHTVLGDISAACVTRGR